MSDRFLSTFLAARRAGTPLMAVQTPDPSASIKRLQAASNPSTPHIVWDACRGWLPAGKPAEQAIKLALDGADPSVTLNPTEQLVEYAPKLPDKSVLYCVNAQRFLADQSASGAAFVQAICNLRDTFKANLRTLVLLGPALTMPPELGGDVLVLDEPLPGDAELAGIVCGFLEGSEIPCASDVRDAAVDALRGLSAFAAEQATAMSTDLKSKTLDVQMLWERKRQMISATPGLTVYQGGETLDDVGGCEQVKRFIRMKFAGKQPPRAVLFIDEGEKAFAGATAGTGDSSGVSQGFLGTMLTWQQDANDKGSSGMLFVGPPGAAKSMVAKATGATFGVPTIALDIGGMKASLVGESEQRLRNALKVIDAVGGGRVLAIMTCNKEVALPPELKRRYKGGTFYFDLPDDAEGDVIWAKYRTRYEIGPKAKRPVFCRQWTGAEIRTACEMAWEMGLPLEQTGDFIVPVSKSAATEIAALRRQADGKYLSASHPGVYTMTPDAPAPAQRRTRALADSEV